jgi:Protein of unknown function (DUF3108)
MLLHAHIRPRLAALLALAACTTALAAPTPRSVQASYNVSMNGTPIAVMNESFEARDGTYRITSESVPLGAVALFQKPTLAVSSGHVAAEGLRPERFEGRRIGNNQQLRAEFDWAGERLTFGQDGKTETVTLGRGTQDRLSIMYQFMYQTFDKRDRLEVAMTDGRRLVRYQYTITPNVEIETPLGRMTTLHLKRGDPDASGNEIWLAPEHHFLPVRMVIRESNGNRYEQVINRIEVKSPSN